MVDARFGVLTSLIGPNNLPTTWTYDSLGRKTGEFRIDETSMSIEYLICEMGTTCSDVTQQSLNSPLAVRSTHYTILGADRQSTVYFDSLGREIFSTATGFEAQLVSKETKYNLYGRVSQISNPYYGGVATFWTSYEYDMLGRNNKIVHSDGCYTDITFNGHETTTKNCMGQTSTKLTNSQGLMIKSTDTYLNSNTYTYDPLGNLVSVEDAVGHVSTMTYDIRGRKKSIDDLDMGSWEYDYDVLGNLVWQKDAEAHISIMAYDKLGRMITRTEPEGVTTWTYDTALNGVGKLAGVSGLNGYQRIHTYEQKGRPDSIKTTISGTDYIFSTVYENGTGRILTTNYPSGFSVKSLYDPASGALKEIRNAGNEALLWKAVQINARGQVYNEDFGGYGLKTIRTYDSATGRLRAIDTGINGGFEVQNLDYTYDGLGSLVERKDNNQNLIETFIYDDLNRLESATIAGLGVKTYQYDTIGNIMFKSDVGTYDYGSDGIKPHAVKIAGGMSYSYDANGNMLNGDGRSLTYTSFNKPQTISKGTDINNTYSYGAEHQRIKKISLNGGVATTTIYIDKAYEVVDKSTGITEYKHYIAVGSATYLYTTRSDNSSEQRYLLKDQLGSTDVITDENGLVKERLSFAPFGTRRAANWNSVLDSGVLDRIRAITPRGFTGHEMDDMVGLINMNARVYDPKLGRFLQADTVIQFPGSTQGYNRYTYVNNNPLSFTDPSGHGLMSSAKGLHRNVSKLNEKRKSFDKKLLEKAVHVAAKYTIGGQIMYSKPVVHAFTGSRYAKEYRMLGSVAASYFGGAVGSAAFQAYLVDIQGGSISDMGQAFATSLAMSYVAGGGNLGGGVSDPVFSGYGSRVANAFMNEKKQELVGNIVEKNTSLSRDEFNLAMFVISAATHAATEDRASEGDNYRMDRDQAYGDKLYDIDTRGVSNGHWWADAADSILAFQGLPTGNTFIIASNYRAGMNVRGHSLGSMEVNNLIAAGVIDGSNARMDGVPFGTVGLASEVNINIDDPLAGRLTNPTANVQGGTHANIDYRGF